MRRSGFSLIELLIVVGIIGLLASIAIPGFIRFQLRSKSAEPLGNLQALAKAQASYLAEHGRYRSVAAPAPASVPGGSKVAFPGGTDFEALGWSPEGGVLFQYMMSAEGGGGGGQPPRFTAEATGDIDLDGEQSYFGYVRPARGAAVGLDGRLPGTTCVGSGVVVGVAGGVLAAAGPCDVDSGHSKF